MSGIQYYFEATSARRGHTDYADAAGGSHRFRNRSSGRTGAAGGRATAASSRSHLNWFTKSPSTGNRRESDKHAIGSGKCGNRSRRREGSGSADHPEPILYHLDTNIRFPKESRGKGLPESQR